VIWAPPEPVTVPAPAAVAARTPAPALTVTVSGATPALGSESWIGPRTDAAPAKTDCDDGALTPSGFTVTATVCCPAALPNESLALIVI